MHYGQQQQSMQAPPAYAHMPIHQTPNSHAGYFEYSNCTVRSHYNYCNVAYIASGQTQSSHHWH